MKATLKPILRFIKPYRMQLAVIIAVLAADVGGSLLVPTITANMINHAVVGGTMEKIVADGILMLLISLVSGALTLLGSWLSSAETCAALSMINLSLSRARILKASEPLQ